MTSGSSVAFLRIALPRFFFGQLDRDTLPVDRKDANELRRSSHDIFICKVEVVG